MSLGELLEVSLRELLETGVCGRPVCASHRPCDTQGWKGELAQSLLPLPTLLWAECGFLVSGCSEKPVGLALGVEDPEFVVRRPAPLPSSKSHAGDWVASPISHSEDEETMGTHSPMCLRVRA